MEEAEQLSEDQAFISCFLSSTGLTATGPLEQVLKAWHSKIPLLLFFVSFIFEAQVWNHSSHDALS